MRLDSGIDEGVQNIDQQIGKADCHGAVHHAGHNRRGIRHEFLIYNIDTDTADSKHLLRGGRSGDDAAELHADHGDNRDQRVS